jgi:hypothetical protein
MIGNDEIRREIDRLSSEIEKLEKERARIDALINPAKRELDSWEQLYTMRTAGTPAPAKGVASPPAQGNIYAGFSDMADNYGIKSRTMRQYILGGVELGVTPKTIRDFMLSQNLPVSVNFVYKTLAKMKENDEIKSEGGVWRPITKVAA